MPASNQPVLSILTCRRLVRSTGGAQPAHETNVSRRSSRTDAHMRAILKYPHLNPLERLFLRDSARQELGQVGSAETNDARARVAVGGREPRPVVVTLGRNGQPLVLADAERAAVRQHGVLQGLGDFGAIRFIRIGEDWIIRGRRLIGTGPSGGAGPRAPARDRG